MYYSGVYIPNENNAEFKEIYSFIIKNLGVHKVIISAYWKHRLGNVPKKSSLSAQLIPSIKSLEVNNKKIYITDDTPNFSFSPKQCKYIRPLSNKNNCQEDSDYFYSQDKKYLPELKIIEKKTKTKLIYTSNALCSHNTCSMEKNNKILYSDEQHLNANGSRYIANFIIDRNLLD
jgi:hypothetical protein